MRKEWILTDEEKYLKREKIVRNRMIKQRAQIAPDHETNDVVRSNIPTTEVRFKSQLKKKAEFFFLSFIH
jgi:hypothetical protein